MSKTTKATLRVLSVAVGLLVVLLICFQSTQGVSGTEITGNQPYLFTTHPLASLASLSTAPTTSQKPQQDKETASTNTSQPPTQAAVSSSPPAQAVQPAAPAPATPDKTQPAPVHQHAAAVQPYASAPTEHADSSSPPVSVPDLPAVQSLTRLLF